MAAVLDPLGSFVYGFVVLLAFGLVIFVLLITIIGVIVALPLFILGYVVWALGSAVAFLAIADRLVGREDGWTKALHVAALNGGLVLTVIGGIVVFVVGRGRIRRRPRKPTLNATPDSRGRERL